MVRLVFRSQVGLLVCQVHAIEVHQQPDQGPPELDVSGAEEHGTLELLVRREKVLALYVAPGEPEQEVGIGRVLGEGFLQGPLARCGGVVARQGAGDPLEQLRFERQEAS